MRSAFLLFVAASLAVTSGCVPGKEGSPARSEPRDPDGTGHEPDASRPKGSLAFLLRLEAALRTRDTAQFTYLIGRDVQINCERGGGEGWYGPWSKKRISTTQLFDELTRSYAGRVSPSYAHDARQIKVSWYRNDEGRRYTLRIDFDQKTGVPSAVLYENRGMLTR